MEQMRKKKKWKCSPIIIIDTNYLFSTAATLYFLCMCAIVSVVSVDNPVSSELGVTCKSINVRNNVTELNKLQRCSVVEGSVMIALIERGRQDDFENYSFPLLKEITDYLVIWRVYHLYTLERLFPNLEIIRGSHLFHNFALVFRNTSLNEIGLKSLKHIMRGSVRIDKNPYLCFADTIDWNSIGKYGQNSHIIESNRDSTLCRKCSADCPKKGYRNQNGQRVGDANNRLCWNETVCQSVCDQKCEDSTGTCYANNTKKCCGETCLGGCSEVTINGRKEERCDVCRFYYKNYSSGKDECVKQCPIGTFEYYDRHCFTHSECVAKSQKLKHIDLKPVEGKCVPDCPVGFIEEPNDKNKCVKCETGSELCSKTCASKVLNNIASIQSLEGCTIISGNLDINLGNTGGANVVSELEKSLKHLVEIRGYLKIFNSSPIVNLNFLANLRKVHGDELDRKIYSFYVVNNPNLQDLWPDRASSNQTGVVKLEFVKGKVFMHHNPYLCYAKIKELDLYATFRERNESSWDIHDVSSNGDKTACNVTKLELVITDTYANSIRIEFQNFATHVADYRTLLGYLINYKEASFRNVSLYEDNDPCTSTWIVKDVGSIYDFNATIDDNSTVISAAHISYNISQLKPFTQYVLYVKTFTTANEDKGAQSDLIYFKTEPDTPSHPLSFEAIPLSDSQILIEWKEPSLPNGIIAYYTVKVFQLEDDSTSSQELTRNYCLNPISFDIQMESKYAEEKNRRQLSNHWLGNNLNPNDTKDENEDTGDNKQCCTCDTIPQIIANKNDETERQIIFENYLINAVYIKRNDTRRRKKRSDSDNTHQGMTFKFDATVDANNTSLTITGLKHYTQYFINVIACHNETETNDNNVTMNLERKPYQQCSQNVNTITKTLPIPCADNIDESSVTQYNQNNTIIISWDEPEDPNGYIVSYNIEYQGLLRKSQLQSCITRDDFSRNNNSYQIIDLPPGNYSFRLQANSIAGSGNWTNAHYFIVVEPPTDSNMVTVLIICAVVGSVAFIAIFIVYYYLQCYKGGFKDRLDYVSVNPEYVSIELESDPAWDVLLTDVAIGDRIGEGQFGNVFKGVLTKNGETLMCAIKEFKKEKNSNKIQLIQFVKEAKKMKKLSECNHVVKLLGIVNVREEPKEPEGLILLLMEYMANCDLKNYLRRNRPNSTEITDPKPPSLKKLLQMAIEIADGMAYLVFNKVFHRDLAARNCMVSEDLTVKIGDFGLAHNSYYDQENYFMKDTRPLPVRWMSPESLKDSDYTEKSDMWSYGIVLWEMVTLGEQPYQGLTNEGVMKYVVKDHGTMPMPDNCPSVFWEIMAQCWKLKPSERPSFDEIVAKLLPASDPRFEKVSFCSSDLKKQAVNNKRMELFRKTISFAMSKLRTDDDDCGGGNSFVNGHALRDSSQNYINGRHNNCTKIEEEMTPLTRSETAIHHRYTDKLNDISVENDV